MPKRWHVMKTMGGPKSTIRDFEEISWGEWIHDKITRWAQLGTWSISILALMVSILALLSGCDEGRPCKDGTTTHATGRGACSGHGGIRG